MLIIISFSDAKIAMASFGPNIENLAIVNSSFLGLMPSNFDQRFSPQALVLLNSTVTAKSARYSVQEGFLFQPKHQMYLLRVESCQIETSERMTFLKANAAVVNISYNILTLDGALSSSIEVFESVTADPILKVVGENVTFSSNVVTSIEDNDVNLTTSNSLEIESNWFDHYFILM